MCNILTLVIVKAESLLFEGRNFFVGWFFGWLGVFCLFGLVFFFFFVSFNRVTLIGINCLYLLWEGTF